MNFSQLEALVAIAETGSFSDAADQIGLTRSAVSHAITNLEAELGVTLLDRERNKATPTTVGNCILKNVREIMVNLENIRQEAAMARGLEMGKLRLGIVASVAPSIWGGILRKFRQEYPGIDIVTFEGTGHEVEQWLLSSTIDVGFILRSTEGIDSVTIGQDEMRVLVSLDHPFRRQRTVTAEELDGQPFIMPKIACDFFDLSWHNTKQLALQQRYEASQISTIISMVQEGLGITVLPSMLLPHSMEGVHLLHISPPLEFMYGVGVLSLRNASPAAQMFILSARSWAAANGHEKNATALESQPALLLAEAT